jgi:hypothetical protein
MLAAELDGANGGGARPADIVIRYGDVPEMAGGEPDLDAGVLCRSSEQGFLFGFDDKVRFAVRDGREIVVDQRPDADPDFVRMMLQGSPFGALLHQRGLLVLHGCSAVIGGRAIAVVGLSGAGKSTLALGLLRRGHTLFGDDVVAIRVSEVGAVALPSFREAKLWGDSAERFAGGGLKQLWPGILKYSMPLPPAAQEEAPLAALVVLELGTEPQVLAEPVIGADRLAMLLTHTYRRNFLKALGRSRQSYAMSARVAQSVPMWRVKRPRRPLMLLDELVEQVEGLAG